MFMLVALSGSGTEFGHDLLFMDLGRMLVRSPQFNQ